jgi:hypothetical protein
MLADPDTVAHEQLHVAAAIALGLEVEDVRWGSAIFDGFKGQVRLTDAAREGLTGSFRDRLNCATVAMVPSLVMFGAEGSEGDLRAVAEIRPDGYTVELWRWVVEQHARKLIASEGFAEAFAVARDRIEQSA